MIAAEIPLRRRWLAWRPQLRADTLALLAAALFTLTCNGAFWRAVLAGRAAGADTALFAAALFIALTALHFLPFGLLFNRWSAKPLLALLIVVTAFAVHFMNRFGLYLDPSMLRNVLHTDPAEAGELLNLGLLPVALATLPPLLLLSRLRIRRLPLRRALWQRALALSLAVVAGVGALLLISQDFVPMMRSHKEIRYLITPANYLYSLARVGQSDARAADRPREPVGTDAALAAGWARRDKPVLLLMVVGETARAANWGLSGYARQTTPELAAADVINFAEVSSCGTSTEVSLPCMFSAVGRRDYDERRIRGSESLLHVLRRAGFRVVWVDNQSGCKGVCDGLETVEAARFAAPGDCEAGRCRDMALVGAVERLLQGPAQNTVLVLHQLGSHGPTYYQRYPDAYRHFTPACETGDLRQCSREQLVNSYDNTLLYTDHVLAEALRALRERQGDYDSAMLYVSDHGESLGERRLYLHGVPYAIAPDEQTRVPMVLWLSPGYAASFGLDQECLRRRAAEPVAHDHLFHSVLGMLEVRTEVYEAPLDLTAGCRRGSA